MKTFKARGASAALGLLAALFLSAAFAESSTPAQEPSIPFANHGGIFNWRADGSKGLWVQANDRQWYYATFMNNCLGLNSAGSLAFDTHPHGTFDRFSTVIVPRWGRCTVRTLQPSLGPPGSEGKG